MAGAKANGATAKDAIVGGISSSCVVTSAAVIMTAVFTVFVSLTAIEYKMMGIGMAVAILIDATVVRGTLLPASMALLGDLARSAARGRHGRPAAPRAEAHTPDPVRPARRSPVQ